MQIKINNKTYEAQEGEMILDVCRRENIPIPTLCAYKELKREAVCRLCLVEINLSDKLVSSCAFQVCEKLEVITESERIRKSREINMELLWSDHAGKCVKCKKNRSCELQNMAEEYKIENFHFVPRKESITDEEERDLLKDNKQRVVVDDKNPAISRTTEYCVECRRCINICPEKVFGFNHRAGDVVVGTPYEKILDCSFCGKCVEACPTAALTDQNDFEKITIELNDLKKMAIAVVDWQMEEGVISQLENMKCQKKFDEILIALGFEKIVNLSKDDLESEVIKNIKTNYARREKIDPEGIVVFFISNKVEKKASKNKYLDYVLTEREIIRLVRHKKLIVDNPSNNSDKN
jgi:NADH dehydrogenase/NADH:ubiquinone oxidoreductase subunit G